MAVSKSSIIINAPIEKVFAYAENPMNSLEYWPSMMDVRNVKDPGNGMKTYDWTYKMAGVKFDGSTQVVECVPNRRLVTVTKGGIESRITWEFTPVEGGTRLDGTAEYKVPVPVLGKLAEALIIKQNEREQETLAANMKALLEAAEKK